MLALNQTGVLYCDEQLRVGGRRGRVGAELLLPRRLLRGVLLALGRRDGDQVEVAARRRLADHLGGDPVALLHPLGELRGEVGVAVQAGEGRGVVRVVAVEAQRRLVRVRRRHLDRVGHRRCGGGPAGDLGPIGLARRGGGAGAAAALVRGGTGSEGRGRARRCLGRRQRDGQRGGQHGQAAPGRQGSRSSHVRAPVLEWVRPSRDCRTISDARHCANCCDRLHRLREIRRECPEWRDVRVAAGDDDVPFV